MTVQGVSRKFDSVASDLQDLQKNSQQGDSKWKSERGAALLEVIIASLFLFLVLIAGNRLLGFYHLNYQQLFISHQELMQKQNER